jgi:hypothetical protein
MAMHDNTLASIDQNDHGGSIHSDKRIYKLGNYFSFHMPFVKSRILPDGGHPGGNWAGPMPAEVDSRPDSGISAELC